MMTAGQQPPKDSPIDKSNLSLGVHVTGISKNVHIETIKILFSFIGPLLCCDMYPNSKRLKEGVQEADLVFANPSDALLALSLNGLCLAESDLQVTFEKNDRRICFEEDLKLVRAESLTSHPIEEMRTLIILQKEGQDTFSNLDDDEIILKSTVQGIGGSGLMVEFRSREALQEFIKENDENQPNDNARICFKEVVQVINPDASRQALQGVTLYGVPMDALLARTRKRKADVKAASAQMEKVVKSDLESDILPIETVNMEPSRSTHQTSREERSYSREPIYKRTPHDRNDGYDRSSKYRNDNARSSYYHQSGYSSYYDRRR